LKVTTGVSKHRQNNYDFDGRQQNTKTKRTATFVFLFTIFTNIWISIRITPGRAQHFHMQFLSANFTAACTKSFIRNKVEIKYVQYNLQTNPVKDCQYSRPSPHGKDYKHLIKKKFPSLLFICLI